MINALDELKTILALNGLSLDDIDMFVIDGEDHVDEILDKEAVLSRFAEWNYDNGFGAVKMRLKLVVVLKKGGYLYRDEHDGSEGWEYRRHTWVPGCSLELVHRTDPERSVELIVESW